MDNIVNQPTVMGTTAVAYPCTEVMPVKEPANEVVYEFGNCIITVERHFVGDMTIEDQVLAYIMESIRE